MGKYISSLWLGFVLLSACSISSQPVPQDHFYRLPEAAIDALPSNHFKSIQLYSVQARGLYNERNILYVDMSRPLTVGRYHYHYWMQTPANLVENYLTQAIQSSGLASRFLDSRSKARAEISVSLEIIRFERVIDDSNIYVEVALQARFDYSNEPSKSWQKLYAFKQPVDSSDMEHTARAFGDVLDNISRMIIQDLIDNNG